jgi:type II secretory pathway component PulM
MSHAQLTRLISSLQAAWQARQPRERKALAGLAGVLALLLLAQAGWSLEQARQGVQRQVPRLAADAEKMRALADEWQLLSADSSALELRPEILRQSIDRQLGELGRQVTARWLAEGELQLQGQVDFATWTRWSATMQQQHRLVPERIRILPAATGIQIDASYRLVATP